MKKQKPIFSKDGNCPHCNSENVRKVGAFGARPSSSTKFPDANKQAWRCDDCGKSFNMLKRY